MPSDGVAEMFAVADELLACISCGIYVTELL